MQNNLIILLWLVIELNHSSKIKIQITCFIICQFITPVLYIFYNTIMKYQVKSRTGKDSIEIFQSHEQLVVKQTHIQLYILNVQQKMYMWLTFGSKPLSHLWMFSPNPCSDFNNKIMSISEAVPPTHDGHSMLLVIFLVIL